MNIHEYQAKKILKEFGATVPNGEPIFLLSEIDEKFRFLLPGKQVVDLGCAPGGWSQVASKRVNSTNSRGYKKVGSVISIDQNEIEPIPGVAFYILDFLSDGADIKVKGFKF